MATNTTRLGLRKPAGPDLVQVTLDIDASMDTIDTAIDRICTSSTRPSTPFVGMRAYETDTTGYIVCVSTGPSVWKYTERICTSVTRPTTAFIGMQIFETDTLRALVCDGLGPVRWRNISTSLINVISSFAEITSPWFNQIVHYQPDGYLYKYNGSSFAKYTPPADKVGGEYRASALQNFPTGLAKVTFGTTVQAASGITWNGTNEFTTTSDGIYAISSSSYFSIGGYETILGNATASLGDNYIGGGFTNGAGPASASITKWLPSGSKISAYIYANTAGPSSHALDPSDFNVWKVGP